MQMFMLNVSKEKEFATSIKSSGDLVVNEEVWCLKPVF